MLRIRECILDTLVEATDYCEAMYDLTILRILNHRKLNMNFAQEVFKEF